MALSLGRLPVSWEMKKFGSKFIRAVVSLENRHVATGVNAAHHQRTVLKVEEEGDLVPSGQTPMPITASGRSSDSVPHDIRFKYPEFLPNPIIKWRNPVKEKLEREDMLARRTQIHIPDFYVGTIMRVTYSNIHQSEKTSNFVGICIERDHTGLSANFLLRNTIDNLGVEIRFYLYDPRLLKIEVLRLEKRLDESLLYLRDALPEYCTFPLDMRPEMMRGDGVPVNPAKVKLKPRPWTDNWHKLDLKGVVNVDELITRKMRLKHPKRYKSWEKYDLMKKYRSSITEDEQKEIYGEVIDDIKKLEEDQLKGRNRKSV